MSSEGPTEGSQETEETEESAERTSGEYAPSMGPLQEEEGRLPAADEVRALVL